MNYKIEWSENGAFVDIKKGFSAEDFSKMENELFSSPQTPTIEYMIISTLNVTPGEDIDIPIAEYGFLRSFADADQALKLAFISTHPTINESIDSYMSKSKEFGNHWQMKRFDNIGDANVWVENKG